MEKLPFIRILTSKKALIFQMTCTNMENLEDLLLDANDMSIMIEKEFTAECCVRGFHVY